MGPVWVARKYSFSRVSHLLRYVRCTRADDCGVVCMRCEAVMA